MRYVPKPHVLAPNEYLQLTFWFEILGHERGNELFQEADFACIATGENKNSPHLVKTAIANSKRF